MSLPHIFMGTLREHYILLFGAAGTIGLLSGFIGSWIGRQDVRTAVPSTSGTA